MNTIHHTQGGLPRHELLRRRVRSTRRVAAAGILGVVMLAACGGDDDDAGGAATDAPAATTAAPAGVDTTAPADSDDGYGLDTEAPATPGDEDAPTTAPAAEGAAAASTAETSIGEVLVDANGMTLYGFTPDTEGEPTCIDDCAGAWPPALVTGEPTFGDLDASIFSVVEHPEGSQLKAGDWPLYTFAGDQAPGDVTGQGSGDVWFAVAPDGTLIK